MQLPPHLGFIISAFLLMAYAASPSILAGQRPALGNQVQDGGGMGEMGAVKCPCSRGGGTTHTHILQTYWLSAASWADCIARLLSPPQIMSHHNRDKRCDFRTNEAASSSSLSGSTPRGSGGTCVDTAHALSRGKGLHYSGGNHRPR